MTDVVAFNIKDTTVDSGDAVAATLSTTLTGNNNDLVFTAVTPGVAGNSITVAYVDPGGTTATLGVVVDGTDIVVNLGRAASAINTTGDLLKAAIEAEEDAAALVTVADKAANDGSGLVTALTETALSGGLAADQTIAEGAVATLPSVSAADLLAVVAAGAVVCLASDTRTIDKLTTALRFNLGSYNTAGAEPTGFAGDLP